MRRTTRNTAQRSTYRSPEEGLRKSRRSRKAVAPLSGRKQPKTQRGLPPVLVRGASTMVQAPGGKHGRVQGRARRRYDVALSVPGAEVRLPALPELHLTWRILSALMVLIFGGMLYYAWTAPMFQVETLQINGLKRLTETDLGTVLGISGQPVFTLHPEELRQELEAAFPELSAVEVKIGLPADVLVEVVEREPVLVWIEEGKEYWLDADGVSFPPRGEAGELVAVEGKRPPMPAPAEGEQSTRFADPVLIAAVIKMSGHLPPDTRLAYDEQHGLGWSDWRGWEIYFGTDVDQIAMKLNVYESLVNNLEQRDIQPELISLEFIHAPYYRLER